jgi:Ca-activated chloride channel family protein
MLLKNSRYRGGASFGNVMNLAQNSLGSDLKNYRNDFLDLVKKGNRLN